MKVLFMTNYPSPYRVDFFNEMGKYCNLTVTFEEREEIQTDREQSWFHTNYNNFRAVFLKNSIKKKNGHNFISFGIINEIKNHYDFIIVGFYATNTSIFAIEYMILHHIPYFIEADGGMAKNGKGAIEKIKYYLISHAENWFSTSKVTDNYLMYYGAKKERIYRYPFSSFYEKDILSAPLSYLQKKIIKDKLGIPEKRVVLSVGRFISIKGFDILIEAARELPEDVGVYIVGGKAPQSYIKLQKIYNLENRVHFVDFKKSDELNEFYKAANLFVLCTRGDVWGLVINEAMSKGLPVITTDKCVAGLELVDEKNGAIINVDNTEMLVGKINTFFELSEKEQGAMCEESLVRIRSYTYEKMVESHLDCFNINSGKVNG